MDTMRLVDPELAPMLEMFPKLQFTREELPAIRAGMAEMFAQTSAALPEFPNITVSKRTVPGPDGAPDVPVIVYVPKGAPGPLGALLWIHGGGYVIGSAEQDDAQVKGMVTQVGCVMVSVDYRLAPETAAPGSVEDCYAALSWLHANAAELGVDPGRIAIGGASAGGGMAAALGLLTRDRGAIPLAFQLLIYPMLDDRTCTASAPHPHVGEFIWTPESNHFGWAALLGHEPGRDDASPYAAPARAESLAGLPPTLISVGALDLFLEEDLEYARRLMREGVPTELHVYPGAFHGFNLMPTARVAQDFDRDLVAALRRALG
ncbi:alpha/beta hydrolase [Oscillochloris sp. ZM17-4]|uniref:alpha/beta hydrolase n=1 Tax=Oscillochloris sp. ZM17-4 TaxID=2866714 RepID=UPI001C737153|nr:alpha/beta hydrolase [Oscillochloris sp. ZM17-4]MBX0331221.1 alpha/beta hydrolase [Oscillochloris sp. ZM17-4]